MVLQCQEVIKVIRHLHKPPPPGSGANDSSCLQWNLCYFSDEVKEDLGDEG